MSDKEDHRGLALALVVGVVGLVAAFTAPRLVRSGPEQGPIARARSQRAAGDKAGALATLLKCAKDAPQACQCIAEAGELAVDINHYSEAVHPMRHTKAVCTSPRNTGGLAEILVAAGDLEEGLKTADEALAQAPDEPHACFAKAWALSAKGSSPEAVDLAERAVRGGRGVPALLVLASLRAGAGDRKGERVALEQARRIDANDPRVEYDVGLLEAGDRHYREAREAFLHALALDPKLADARYQLVVLTHSVKADDEAQHHLDELAAIAPGDPRLPGLRAELKK